MGRIKVLSEQVANRIAAGEVVVRPASVVKELVENALDAGARKVVVEVTKAGKELIRVVDDGCGMDKADAQVAFQRHATSKIVSDHDLFALTTYGFRGEALPSIASVAMVSLTTAQEGSLEGVVVHIDGGSVRDVKVAPPIVGTQVDVRNLFFNTPARRKFLKNDATEFNHIMETVIHQALTALPVSWELWSDGKKVLALVATDDLRKRLGDIYGASLAEGLYPVSGLAHGDLTLQLSGYVSRPELTRANRNLQRLFVNGRAVKDKAVSYAVQSAYAPVLPGGRFPVSFLFVQIAPDAVDVNVHPTKDEVKFRDEALVRSVVQRSLKQALDAMSHHEVANSVPLQKLPLLFPEVKAKPEMKNQDLHRSSVQTAMTHFYDTKPKDVSYDVMRESAQYHFYQNRPEPTSPMPEKVEKEKIEKPETQKSLVSVKDEPITIFDSQSREQHGVATDVLEKKLNKVQRFFKVKDLFVVTETDEGIVIIDQHAAQERVMYERLLNRLDGHGKAVQDLLVPLTLELSKADIKLLDALLPAFQQLGFVLEHFGEHTALIRTVPAFIRERDVVPTVHDILDHVRDLGVDGASLLPRFDEVLATMACRASIKAGDKVSDIELSHIFQELQQCDDPYTCPHGRPTMIRFTFDELEKKFRRKK